MDKAMILSDPTEIINSVASTGAILFLPETEKMK